MVCGMPAERTGMAQRITQTRIGFTNEFRARGGSIACRLRAKGLDFAVGQDARGLLSGVEDACDEGVVGGNSVALEPEEDIGLPAHRPDLDDLVEAEQMRRDAAVDDIGEARIFAVKGLDDSGGVHAGGSAEGVAADDRVVWRDGGARGFGDFVAIFLDAREVAIEQAHEAEIDEHKFHRRVSDAFAE